jgi:hypothetical protein
VGDVATLAKRQQQQEELLRLQGGQPGLLANEQIEFSEAGAEAAAGGQEEAAPLEEMDDPGNEA